MLARFLGDAGRRVQGRKGPGCEEEGPNGNGRGGKDGFDLVINTLLLIDVQKNTVSREKVELFRLELHRDSADSQTTLSTKACWHFRTKRHWKESCDDTRLRTLRFYATVQQTRRVQMSSTAAKQRSWKTTKRQNVSFDTLGVSYKCTLRYHFHGSCLDDMTPYENVVLCLVWFGPNWVAYRRYKCNLYPNNARHNTIIETNTR